MESYLLDPNDPRFPIKEQHVQRLRAVMFLQNENAYRKIRSEIVRQGVPEPLVDLLSSVLVEGLPPGVKPFWDDRRVAWEANLDGEWRAATEQFCEGMRQSIAQLGPVGERGRPLIPMQDGTAAELIARDDRLSSMLRSSYSKERANYMRSKARAN